MIYFATCLLLALIPPREIPPHLYSQYTLEGRVPVYEWYFNNAYPPEKPIVFHVDEIKQFILDARGRKVKYYDKTDPHLYFLFDKYRSFIEGKRVAIIGTTVPWYESIVLAYGGHPVTIEYNKIVSEDPRIQVMTVDEYWKNPEQFDIILSVSSIEHDGLGRYGDPINPEGDFETMKKLQGMLKEEGLLFLSVPVGEDSIYWNAHRQYGRLRLPLLLKGWEVIESSGFSENDFSVSGYHGHQPVFILRPQK
jgi:hypothetical protein